MYKRQLPARPRVGGVARLRKARCDAQASAGPVRSPAAARAAISLRCFALRCAAAPPPQRQPVYAYAYGAVHIPAPIRWAMVWRVCTTAVPASSTAQYGAAVISLYGTAVLRARLYSALCVRVQGLPVHPSVRLYASSTATVLVQLYCSCRRCYGAYATALLLPAYICCVVYAVCMRMRLLILCCCMYVGAPAAAVVAMIWRRSGPLHTRR